MIINQLQRIKNEIKYIDALYLKGQGDEGRELLEGLNDQCDIDWLIAQLEYAEKKDDEIKRLQAENEKLREADKIVKVLYVGLGMNVDGDLKLWKKTEAYVKSLEETK